MQKPARKSQMAPKKVIVQAEVHAPDLSCCSDGQRPRSGMMNNGNGRACCLSICKPQLNNNLGKCKLHQSKGSGVGATRKALPHERQGLWLAMKDHAPAWTDTNGRSRGAQCHGALLRYGFSRCRYLAGSGPARMGTRGPLRCPSGTLRRRAAQPRAVLVHARPAQTPPAAAGTCCAGRPTPAGPGRATLTLAGTLGPAGHAPARPQRVSATRRARAMAAGCCCAAARTPATSAAAAGPRAAPAAAALRVQGSISADAACSDRRKARFRQMHCQFFCTADGRAKRCR